MRLLGVLLLLAALSFGEHVTEVAKTKYVGSPVAIAAVAAGDAYLPTVLTQRADPRGHWRCVNLRFGRIDQAKLSGDAKAMARHGGGVVFVTERNGQLTVTEIRYDRPRPTTIHHGTVSIGDLKRARVLRVTSTPNGPVVVVGHASGLVVATLRGKRAQTDLIARPGRDFVAATEAFHADRNGRLDLFVAGNNRIARLEQSGRGFQLVGELDLPRGLRVRAMAGIENRLWIAGAQGGSAMLVQIALDRQPRKIRKAEDVLKEVFGEGKSNAVTRFEVGRGSLDHLEVLARNMLVAGGALDGRSWIGVIRPGGRRPSVLHSTHLPGAGVLALGINPSRRGWSIAAGTRDKTYHLLRIPGDPALPRGWEPFPRPGNEPPADTPPAKPPETDPPAGNDLPPIDEPDPCGHGGDPATVVNVAVFPRVEVDSRLGWDTHLVLVHLGKRRTTAEVAYVANTGRVLHTTRLLLRPGTRVKLSVVRELRKLSIPSFDGYVRIDGCSKRTLVVEGLLRKDSGKPEVLRAHWR